jgi:hypothetical protein
MAPCQTFVSLLRSCYSTKARFFKDDPTIEHFVEWYFTDPGAKWVGLENQFNARTWYGGYTDWPELGEIEGAPRTWVDGSGECRGNVGPFGTSDQWADGAYKVDALVADPCPRPPDALGFSEIGTNITVGMSLSREMVRYGDNWSLPYPDPVSGPDWFTVTATSQAVCCFPRGTTVAITGPPPGFAFIRTPQITDAPFNGCTVERFFDPVEGLDVQLIAEQ